MPKKHRSISESGVLLEEKYSLLARFVLLLANSCSTLQNSFLFISFNTNRRFGN